MEIIQDLLTNGRARPKTKRNKTNGIVIHYVGNAGSSAKGNRDFFNNPTSNKGDASAHYVVGLKGEVIQCIPDEEVAHHAGRSFGAQWDAIAKTNNFEKIGIEVCHPDSSGKFNEVTYKSLVELTKLLMKKFGLTKVQIFRHYDVTGKMCPLYYVKNPTEWEKMKDDIMGKEATPMEAPKKTIVLLDGEEKEVMGYMFNGENYPRLKDLQSSFINIGYDATKKMATITTVKPKDLVKIAKVVINKKEKDVAGIMIDENNFLKAADLKTDDIRVGYNAESKQASIDTK